MDRLKRFCTRIWQDKVLLIFCLVVAFIAWHGIYRSIGFEIIVSNVVLDVQEPEGWALWEASEQRVNIAFRGSQEAISFLNQERLRVVVAVPGQEESTGFTPPDFLMSRIRLEEAHVLNPTGTRVTRFIPPEILVKFDRKESRDLPVKAVLEGSLRDGLEVERVLCEPGAARVTGARRLIEGLESLSTLPLSLNQRSASFMEKTSVSLPPDSRLEIEPEWVNVTVELAERTRDRTFMSVPLRILGVPLEKRRIGVVPDRVNVVVGGAQQRVEKLSMENLTVYVRCDALTASTAYDLPVQVDLPDGIRLIKTEPSVVKIEIGIN